MTSFPRPGYSGGTDAETVGPPVAADDWDDLDDVRRAELPEMPSAVAHVLDDWLMRKHGVMSSAHGVGLFLDLLAAEGYRVGPIVVPPSTALGVTE